MMNPSVDGVSPVTLSGFGAGEMWHARRSTEAAMHALIIEDESLIALAIEEALRECGFTSFDLATTQEEAVESAERQCPDLITADVQLKPGCGITAVQSICSGRQIPVIFITGSPDQVRMRMPGHPLIEKPFSAPHLMAAAKLTLDSTDD